MLTSLVASSTKQSSICKCQWRVINSKSLTAILLEDCLYSIKQQRVITTKAYKHQQYCRRAVSIPTFAANSHTSIRPLNKTPNTQVRSITAEAESKIEAILNDRQYNTREVLSFALNQSNVPIAESLVQNTFSLLRKNKIEAAWDCYLDLSNHHLQGFLSADQFKRLIKIFNHKSNHEKGLEYMLTLIEDMKRLGYSIGRKEKVLLMRLLAINGKLEVMEQIFNSLKAENQQLARQDVLQAQKPYHIALVAYFDNVRLIGSIAAATKSMATYEEMLDKQIYPTESTTQLLMQNLRFAKVVDVMLDDVWAWVLRMVEMHTAATRSTTLQLDPDFFREMVIYFSSAGRADNALQIYDLMIKMNIPRTLRMMTALIHKVGRSGDVERSMKLFNDMVLKDDITPNLITFSALIDIHAHKKPQPDIPGAERMFQSLLDLELKPNEVVFGILLDMYAKQGDIENVRRIFKQMVHEYKIKPSPHMYSSFIKLFMTYHDHESAYQVLTLLRKEANRRVSSARAIHNLMLKRLVQHGCVVEALQLIDVMTKEKLPLETRTFSPLLAHYSKRGDVTATHKVANMMTQANCRPNAFTYYCLLQSFARAGDISGAEAMFDVYKARYRPDTNAYNAMLYVYTKRSEMDKVLGIYRRMTRAGVPANEYTYGILMNYYTKRKELNTVVSLLDTMHENNVEPSVGVWTILMEAYFKCGQPDEGRQIIQQMKKAGVEPSSISWAVLIRGFVKSDMTDVAQAVLNDKIDAYKRQSENQQKVSLRNSEMNAEMYSKDIPLTFEDLLNQDLKPAAQYTLTPYLFTPIIQARCNQGDYEEAKKLIRTMCDLTIDITIPTYSLLMKVFKQSGQHNAVEKLWRALYSPEKDQTIVTDLDPLLPSVPVPKPTYNYLNLLTLDADLESVESVPNKVTPFALSIYLDSLTEQSRFSDIDKLWNELSQAGYNFDEHNWNKYISSLLVAENLQKACTVIPKQFLQASVEVEGAECSEESIAKHTRNGSFMASGVQLHVDTCKLFAEAFNMTGIDFTRNQQLRATIIRRITEYLAQKDSLVQ